MRTLKQIVFVLGGDKLKVAGLCLLMTLGACLEALGVGLVVPIVGFMTQSGRGPASGMMARLSSMLGSPEPKDILGWGAAAVLLIYASKNAYLAALARLQFRFTAGRQSFLARVLFDRYLRESYAAHLQRNSAQVLQTLNFDVHWMFSFVIIPALKLASEALVGAAVVVLLLVLAPAATIAVLAVLVLVTLPFYKRLHHWIKDLGDTRKRAHELMLRWIQQGLGGFKETKILNREDFFLGRFDHANLVFAEATAKVFTAGELPRLFTETVVVTGVIGVLFALMSLQEDISQLAPMLALFAAAAFRLTPSINRMMNALNLIRPHLSYLEQISSQLAADRPRDRGRPPAASAAREALGFRSSIELRGVVFTYPGSDEPALKGVSLHVAKGAHVGLIGPSGGGKSTTIDVLLGLLAPGSGEVLVDGVDIKGAIPQWQAMVGYIPQPIYLYDDSLRRNIAFALLDEEIDDAKVWSALRTAQLEDFVRSLPKGLATDLGERGVRLSGGQRQRIGIARVLYRDPEVLVLDEATSELDPETEAEISKVIHELHGMKTVITVAHRLSTVARCDRLFLLKAGIVSAAGTYAELSETSPDFQALAKAS